VSGYTPVFNSVLDGTLYGRWPHTGIWMCLLSQCDRNGNVDMVPGLLAAKIGVPVDTLLQCIADFMLPDPGSRTIQHEGRRLELIDPAARNWGWRVLNHAAYREKARKQAYDAKRTESGADAERKRMSRDIPTPPAYSRSHTPNSNTNKTLKSEDRLETVSERRESKEVLRKIQEELAKRKDFVDDTSDF